MEHVGFILGMGGWIFPPGSTSGAVEIMNEHDPLNYLTISFFVRFSQS
jgi:hypothetical protein